MELWDVGVLGGVYVVLYLCFVMLLWCGVLGVLCCLQDPFKNTIKLESVTCPTLVIHGASDFISPLPQGQAIHDCCASKYVLAPRRCVVAVHAVYQRVVSVMC